MCGIFGWTLGRGAKIAPEARRALARTLVVANARRGPHSWGAYRATADGTCEVLRGVGSMASANIEGKLSEADTAMGHTRWATVGAVTVENCHPFEIGGVVVAHNGGIFNHADLSQKYGRNCAVDSQHVAHHLAEGLSFEDMEGYGAIEYVRMEEPAAVRLCRMRGGDLAVYGLGTREAPEGVVWSSDASHLRAALYDARLDAFPYEKMREGRVYLTDRDGVLYILPEKFQHVLGQDRLSADTRRRHMEVTSGKAKDAKPPPPALKPGQIPPPDAEAEAEGSRGEREMIEAMEEDYRAMMRWIGSSRAGGQS